MALMVRFASCCTVRHICIAQSDEPLIVPRELVWKKVKNYGVSSDFLESYNSLEDERIYNTAGRLLGISRISFRDLHLETESRPYESQNRQSPEGLAAFEGGFDFSIL
ncbi:hypothetical protein X777_05848 [Ooceraea biroi]|uniref:Uncharacterized protein n=1 Tax=Ooceraea biroi TaxID=2015173 RepID=A0A026WG33_OOCBI|nr:hypothetical protein X777_05848 [Ooceraea biroi]